MIQKFILALLLSPFVGCTKKAHLNETEVIHHPAKAGIYEAFTSAHFGDAGRWMTTNLAARAYDTNINTATLPAAPSGKSDTKTSLWCYPSATSPSTRHEYIANKDLGLLYNWAAATATTQNANATDEAGASYAYRQGICPNGWHVPSDKEWTELAAEFAAHKSKYSSLANDSSTEENGTAMRDILAKGLSKPAIEGGFAALLAGYANNDSSGNFASGGYFWNSSSYDSSTARFCNVNSSYATMNHYHAGRSYLFSVRCKQD